MTLTYIIPVIVVIIITVIALVIMKRSRNNQNQSARNHCQEALKTILPALSPDLTSDSVSDRIWVDILKRNDYLKMLNKSGSMIIFGDASMGLSAVLRNIVSGINQKYNETNRLAVYINIPEIPCQVGSIETALPDEIYRSIITSTIDTLLWNVQQNTGDKYYKQSGLNELDILLKDELGNSIIEMPITEIGQTLNKIMGILGIKQIKICLNDISSLQSNTLPFVLSLLVRTFQASGQIDLVFGGDMDKLQLITDTSEGPVGIQFGHDIFMGLNLRELLLPQIDQKINIEVDQSPRMQFLSTAIGELKIFSENHSNLSFAYAQEIFTSTETVKTLFQYFNGNLQQILETLKPLYQWSKENGTKVDVQNYHDIYPQCQNFIVK